MENWVILIFSGQEPCTSYKCNELYEITPKKRFLVETEKINFKCFKWNLTYDDFHLLCFSIPVKFEIYFLGKTFSLSYFIQLVTFIPLEKSKKNAIKSLKII